jgi:RNA polymerase sigma-70 factor (ECF subfamily)
VAAMRAAIRRLAPEQRELVHLYYELGRSVAEIADVLGLAPGTVKSRLFAIRETLKRQLERQKQHE